ncbi:hypothetical protein CPB84DRAFT_1847299 [Gymnopilus junonius]|uniref:NAD-dependent epimerase/dehydratase domain-containing protein n=1 Tax=Gymnopilus junonius TaxID=109634 RepID=A0A9P5NKG9_GYMJU|nr:hypothetical protein CPB84DRAFT_1847299 [Gymnopilus junonius]
MPVVKPQGTRVLVTGANGYIGMWVVRTLLEQGYVVRAVVRSLERGKHMKAYFNSYGDKLELSVVEDITKDGAFDEAVKDVDAIEHTASPSTFALEDPNAYITPAVHGTLSILESARKFGNKVKRIVITSSVLAMYITTTPVKATVIVDESFWNEKAIELVKEKGKEEEGIVKYSASKTLAEKAAWKFREKHKNEIQWDLVTIHPSFVLGGFNVSLLFKKRSFQRPGCFFARFWNMIAKNKPDSELKDTLNFVDVRDTAAAHVAALRKEKAGDERFIVSTGKGMHLAENSYVLPKPAFVVQN